MKRRILNAIAVLSALMCVAVIVLGVISRWRSLTLTHMASGQEPDRRGWSSTYALCIVGGRIFLYHSQIHSPRPLPGSAESRSRWITGGIALRPGHVLPGGPLGFGWERRENSQRGTESKSWRPVVPDWFVATIFAIFPALRLGAAIRSWKRHPEGRCQNCGYDLRATPEKGGALLDRCPECGTVPAAKAPVQS